MSKYIPTASFTEKANLPNDDSSVTHDEMHPILFGNDESKYTC